MFGFSKAWLYGAIAAFFAGLLAFLRKVVKQNAKQEVEIDALKETAKKEKEGRDAVAKEQAETDGLSKRAIVDRLRGRNWD